MAAQQVSYAATVQGVVLHATAVAALVPVDSRRYLVSLSVASPTPDDQQYQADAKSFIDQWRITTG